MFTLPTFLTLVNAKSVFDAGCRALHTDDMPETLNLSSLKTIDSSAVAVLVAWQAAAHQHGKRLYFSRLPHHLKSLIDVYGAEALLPLPIND